MIRNIQNLPAAGQKAVQTRKTPPRNGADFGSMLQSQMRRERQEAVRPENDFSSAAAQAQFSQEAALRQVMGIQPVSAPELSVNTADALSGVSGTALPARDGTALPTQGGTAFPARSDTVSGPARQTVNFSKHAMARVEARGIQLTDALLDKLADSVERAQEKGAKNILAFDTTQAFIINIPYSRVITAISQEEMRENIFTNIDGAVLL